MITFAFPFAFENIGWKTIHDQRCLLLVPNRACRLQRSIRWSLGLRPYKYRLLPTCKQQSIQALTLIIHYLSPISVPYRNTFNALTWVFIIFVWVETKGKSLEEIDILMDGEKHDDVPDVYDVIIGKALDE